MLAKLKRVYKVMKKVGNITEARMVKREEPKFHPLVSDSLFENVVKGYPEKGIKGGTAAARKEMKKRKKLKEDELAGKLQKDQTPEASKMTTNSPRRATPKSVQVGGPYDLTAEATTVPKNKGTVTSLKGTKHNNTFSHKAVPEKIKPQNEKAKFVHRDKKRSAAKELAARIRSEGKKNSNWIQGAEADIERRGTEGKCTPITKPGCTGRARALAKTFKKMAKKKDAKIVSKKEKAAMKEQDTNGADPKYATPEMRKQIEQRKKAIEKFRKSLGQFGDK